MSLQQRPTAPEFLAGASGAGPGGKAPEFRLMHVGVAATALEPALETLTALFGYRVDSGPFDDPIQKVTVLFLTTSSTDLVELELIAPLTADSPIRSMLSKSGGGAYHLCFETPDLQAAIEHAQRNRCVLVSEPAAATAFGGRPIAWIYTPTRQLFELVQAADQS